MNENDTKEKHEQGHNPEHDLVTITIDTKEYKIKKGVHTVVSIKQLGGVPIAYELEQVVGGKLTPLADDASVVIHGGEIFLSHPKDGGAS